jgi:hypothetical protein
MKRLFAVLLILGAFTMGCKLIDSLRGAGSGGGSGVASSGDPRADIVAASQKLIALKSFTANMEGTGEMAIKSQVAYLAPDRFHVKYLGGTGAGMELIYVGSKSYIKPAGGNWSVQPGDAKTIPNLRDSFTEEGLRTMSNEKFEGNDMVDGKPALVY